MEKRKGGKTISSQKRQKWDEDSELDTDSGSESEDDDLVDFDVLDSDKSKVESNYDNESDHNHDHGDDEDILAEDIIKAVHKSTCGSLRLGLAQLVFFRTTCYTSTHFHR